MGKEDMYPPLDRLRENGKALVNGGKPVRAELVEA
jgi:hypothetical protein